jgi:hypothetical protein
MVINGFSVYPLISVGVANGVVLEARFTFQNDKANYPAILNIFPWGRDTIS